MGRERRETVVDVARDVVSIPDVAGSGDVLEELPSGSDWRFEPDWDGFGVTARLTRRTGTIVSDRQRSFDRYFPEVVRTLSEVAVDDVVVRGSLVVVTPTGISFATLRRRLQPTLERVGELAVDAPATLVLTDLLTRGQVDLRGSSLIPRRRALERLAIDADIAIAPANLRGLEAGTPIVVSPQTPDAAVARARWLADDGTDRSGVIARHIDGRRWARVRRTSTAACVVTGYRRSGSGDLASVRLGLYDEAGELVDVGRTIAFRRVPARRAAASALATVSSAGGPAARSPWVDVLPALVCEVRFDRLRGQRFRHAVTFEGWLPDRDPATCTLDQLHRGA